MQTGLCFQLNSLCLPLILFSCACAFPLEETWRFILLLLLYFHPFQHLFRLLSIHGIVFLYLSFDAMRRSFQLVFRITAWASCLDTFTRSLCHLKGDAKAHFISFSCRFLHPSPPHSLSNGIVCATHTFIWPSVYWFNVENRLFDTDGFGFK